MDIDLSHYKDLLIRKRKELLAMLEAAKESVKPVELDQTSTGRLSRMDAMQVQAMALALERRRKEELGRIGAALMRIEEGEYGYCLNCEEPIAPKRLEFNPSAVTCIECASRKR